MEYDKIENNVVKAAYIAWNNRDRDGFLKLVTKDTTFIHNGKKDDIVAWADQFFFGPAVTIFTTLVKLKDNGTSIYAGLDSEIAGKATVLMRFTVVNGKIAALNAGRPDDQE